MNSESASVRVLSSGSSQATAQVISLGEVHEPSRHQAGTSIVGGLNPLHAIRTKLHVSVGEVEISIGDLLAAQENQVLVLDRTVDQPVDLLLEGKVVARGQLVAVEGSFGLRITELPQALKP